MINDMPALPSNREIEALPPVETRRWVARRKAAIVTAVRQGTLTVEEACGRYQLSVEEFQLWAAALDHAGIAGLRVTRIQAYRPN